MEFVPLRFFSRLSAGVPFPARSASVFFTTLYLPPAACTARRSFVSASTVMPWKVVRITVDTLASSPFNLSRSCCFSLRFFMIPFPQSLRRCGHRLGFPEIDRNSRPHRGRQRNLLHVPAFGCRGLRFHDCRDHRVSVFRQLGAIE